MKAKKGAFFSILFCLTYFALFFSLYLYSSSATKRVASKNYRWLDPVTAFGRISAPGDVDEGKYERLDSFLSKHFDRNQPLDFRAVGHDQPGQPLRGHPFGVSASHDGKKVYVSLPGNEAEPLDIVALVEPDNGRLTKTIRVGRGPFGLALHPKLDLIFVTHLYSDYVSVIDTNLDAEVARLKLDTPSGVRFYAQKIAWVRNGELLLITNRMTDSLLVYRIDDFEAKYISEIALKVENSPIDTGDEPAAGPFNISADVDHRDPAIDGLTANSNPPGLRRTLRNVNPRDVVVFEDVWLRPSYRTDVAFIANVNGLGVSVVDLNAAEQVGSLDLNSPALGLAKYVPDTNESSKARRLLFIATGGRFAASLDDITSELAVVSVDENPFGLISRYTSVGLPSGPSGGPGTAAPVPPTGDAPYLSAFSTTTGTRANDSANASRDRLPELLTGALPFQLEVGEGFLVMNYAASDQIEIFSINPHASVAADILVRKGSRFTNSAQVAFPTTRLHTLLSTNFGSQGLLDYPVYSNGSLLSGKIDDAQPITGERERGFFDGRHPAGLAIHGRTRRVYVANRLGESVSIFEFSNEGNLIPARVPVVDLRGAVPGETSPLFPATLAEMGEDFYTSSRVMLSRRQACLSCHPDTNTDSKSWAVSAAPGNSRRRVQTNRNLRDTAPYGFAGTRSNLEICARNLRSFSPDPFFGASLDVKNHAFRDANENGVKSEEDRGRPQAEINREAMYVLERTGIGFEYVSAAIAAFLEVEPRLQPNPFREAGGSLSKVVALNLNDDHLTIGNAVRGEQIFRELGCAQCHTPPLFTSNRTFTRYSNREADGFDLVDLANTSILDGVVLSHEESGFGAGSYSDWVDPRMLPIAEQRVMRGVNGGHAYPLERSLENAIDCDPHVFGADTLNFFSFAYQFPKALPRSMFYRLNGERPGFGDRCGNVGRLLSNEPHFMPDREINATGGDGRNVNVPSLRNAWEGAPYLHHGRAATLLDVISDESEFNFRRDPDAGTYVSGPLQRHGGIAKLRGRDQDKLDLVAFLMSIQ